MQVARLLSNLECKHSDSEHAGGLAVITVGNSLRGDQGLAAAISKSLPKDLRNRCCRFDLGSYSGFLQECLIRHKAAIIIDATKNGTAPGTVSMLDVSYILTRAESLKIKSCQGLMLSEEVRSAKMRGRLPKQIIFFGIEIDRSDWNEKISDDVQRKLPRLVSQLSFLISKVAETLGDNAA